MFVTLIRAVIVYVLISFSVRLMGKRQIGELQPSELIITLLLSELVTIPMQDNDLPLLNSIIPVLVLVSMEVVSSVLSMKSKRFRSLIQGNSLVVIRDGKMDQNVIRELRFTVDDLLSALRQKDVYDIAQVQYAILETNGSLSVLLKPEYRTVTAQDMQLPTENTGMPHLIINDGKPIGESMQQCGMTEKKLNTILKRNQLRIEDVFIMTMDDDRQTFTIPKDAVMQKKGKKQ